MHNVTPLHAPVYKFKVLLYDEKKCCFRSLSIPISYLAKMHHINHCGSISKTSLSVSRVVLSIERAGLREKLIFQCVNPAN